MGTILGTQYSSQLDGFYKRLRRAGVLLWTVATVLVLVIANVPGWNEGIHRLGVNLLGLASLSVAAVAFRLPVRLLYRRLFIPRLLSVPLLIALLVYLSGGSRSPFDVYYFPVAIFAAFYLQRSQALLVAIAVSLASLLPLVYSDFASDLTRQHLQMAAGYFVLVWVCNFLVVELLQRERARRELEEDLIEVSRLRDELERANALERRRAMQFEAVHAVGREVAAILDVSALQTALVQAVHTRLGYEVVALYVADKPRGGLVLAAHVGLGVSLEDIDAGRVRFARGVGVVGHVASTRSSFRAATDGSESEQPGAPAQAVRSELAAPLLAGRKLLGVLDVGSAELGGFDELDVITLESVADYAAVALQNARAHEMLAERATTDVLTDTLNHRALIEHLDTEVGRARRFRRHLSVLFLDLDHFKRVNDTYGHEAGNVVLRDLAQLVGSSLRAVDALGRYGGEEFVAVLPETESHEAVRVAERLRAAVAAHDFKLNGGVKLTVSIGVATSPENGETGPDLLRSADRALYHAKDSGRDRVHAASGIPAPGATNGGELRPLRLS